jgi:hypothetical protein
MQRIFPESPTLRIVLLTFAQEILFRIITLLFHIYTEWQITDSISVSPVLGFYTPDNSLAEGGSQLGGGDDTNTYMQATLLLNF